MDRKTWTKVEDIVDTVLSISEKERSTCIEQKCGGDVMLKQHVTELLKSIEASEGFLETKNHYSNLLKDFSLDISEAVSQKDLIGERLGNYIITGVIAQGGMGSVFEAERADESYKNKVAIKILRKGMETEDVLARFRIELQILARLNHPNITHLLDAGLTSDARPYFVMEYVEGKPITTYCNENKLSVKERLKLFLQVCDALQYAHQNLVIHRDLKPGNILVTEDGRVKLLDFGIAKVLSEDFSPNGGRPLTRQEQMVFTPEYASPEQLKGSPVNTASDIYSLGVVLYELLTNTRPYNFQGLNRLEMVQDLQAKTISQPSASIKTTSDCDSKTDLSSQVENELDDVVLKGLRIEPNGRYESVEQFRQDLLNYLNNRPVTAKADSRRYRLAKFWQRNRTVASLGALSLILFFTGVTGILWQSSKAQQEAQRAIVVKDFLENMITASNPWVNPEEPLTAKDLIDQGASMIEEELDDRPALAAELLGVIGASYQGMREDNLAEEYLSKAVNLLQTDAELDPITTAKINAGYAGALLRAGDPAEAESLARQSLDNLNDDGNTGEVKSQLLSMLANAQSLLGNPLEAQSNAREAADIVCESTENFAQSCINAQMELRHFHEWAGNFEAGLDAAEYAFRLADSTNTGISEAMRLSVVGNYGNALSYNARTTEAIPILEQNTEHARESYGDDSYRYARALHDLVSAYMYAGRTHEALPYAEQVFEIGGTAQPGNPMNAYWLHQLYQLALDLLQPDRAEAVFSKYEDMLPQQMSSYYVDAFEIEHLRLEALRNPEDPNILVQAEALLEKFGETDSPVRSNAALLAAEQALGVDSLNAAARFLKEFDESVGALPASNIQPARATYLKARHLALLDKLDEAMEEAQKSLNMLREIGHRDSPFIAENRALLAEIHCRKEHTEEGLSLLDEAVTYWTQTAEVPAGEAAMENIAPACLP